MDVLDSHVCGRMRYVVINGEGIGRVLMGHEGVKDVDAIDWPATWTVIPYVVASGTSCQALLEVWVVLETVQGE